MKEQVMPHEAMHTHWDATLPPALTIDSGDAGGRLASPDR